MLNAGVPRQRPGAAESVVYSAFRYRIGYWTSVSSTVGSFSEQCGVDHAPHPSVPYAAPDEIGVPQYSKLT